MRYRKLSPTGDYTFGTGADFYIDSPATVAQAILTRLRLWRGEWFVNLDDGVPYYSDVLGKYTQAQRDAVIRRVVTLTPGVKSIVRYSSTYDSAARTFTVSMVVDTIYGQAVVNIPAPDVPGRLDIDFVLGRSLLG